MSANDKTNLEIAILRGLISSASGRVSSLDAPTADNRRELLDRIAGHAWADEEHRVVYECFRSAQGHRRARLREEMAAEATRMGHPDVDWDVYFRQGPATDADLSRLIRRLKNNL